MKIQNLAIIFIVIILPLLFILGYYLNLQSETLELQAEYDTKLAASVKEGIKAYEVNTVNWREVQGEERRNVTASMNTFITSLANNLGIAGTAKEYMINYIPAVVMTMYDGYYIYSPTYSPNTIENDQGIQLYYDNTNAIVTTDTITNGNMNDVIYEPSTSATNIKTGWYTYTDENGNEQKKSYTFVTDAAQANKTYEHTVSNKIAYSATYTKGTSINVTINYTLDNRIYVYGTDGSKDIQETGCLVYFNSSDCSIPRITIKNNPQDEDDIIVNEDSRIDKLVYNGSNINAEILTEQIVCKENTTSQANLETYKYIYDIQGTKLYYDEYKDNFFTLNAEKVKIFISDDANMKVGEEDCHYKSVSILTSDSTYKKLYQVLNGRDKGKWYINF